MTKLTDQEQEALAIFGKSLRLGGGDFQVKSVHVSISQDGNVELEASTAEKTGGGALQKTNFNVLAMMDLAERGILTTQSGMSRSFGKDESYGMNTSFYLADGLSVEATGDILERVQ